MTLALWLVLLVVLQPTFALGAAPAVCVSGGDAICCCVPPVDEPEPVAGCCADVPDAAPVGAEATDACPCETAPGRPLLPRARQAAAHDTLVAEGCAAWIERAANQPAPVGPAPHPRLASPPPDRLERGEGCVSTVLLERGLLARLAELSIARN